MFTLLAPAALVGLSLLAIPVVIHLLKPRKVRRTPFSSLRWLQLTQQRLSRRLRWHQFWLFLLRAAFITLLVLAVARPIFDRRANSLPSERFIILDVSRSMSYRADNSASTPLDRGKQAAAELLAGGGAEDRTALVTVGTQARILGTLARGGERHVPKLSGVAAEPTDTNLGAALDSVRTLLSGARTDSRIELYLITDDHQGSWRPGSIESFVVEYPDRVTATLVNTAEPGAQNGWIASAHYSPAERGAPPVVDVQLRAVGAGTQRTVRLTGATGLNERSQVVALDPARPTDVRFELPVDFDPRGKACEVVLDPPDALPSDDRWYLSFDSGASLNVLVIEGRSTSVGGVAPGFALQTAIEALASPVRSIRVVSKKYNEVEAADMAMVDVILCADVPELSDLALDELTDRVQHGVGLGVFLGPGVNADFYNARLIDPLQRAKSLLPVRLDRVVDVPLASGGLAPIEAIAWTHPLLAGLFDPELGDLAQVAVRSYYHLAPLQQDTANVLARVGDSPLLIEHSVGAGKVVLCSTTADDAWSDLPRRKSFVPLMDRLLNYLSDSVWQRTFNTGEAVTLSLPPLAPRETVSVVAPSGSVLTPNLAASSHGARLSLPPLAEPGVYQVRRSGGESSGPRTETSFVVQVGRGDSVVESIDADALRSRWQPVPVQIVPAEAVRQGTSEDRRSLVVWAVLLAALLLGVETMLVHRLCPRMNPAVAESIVRRRPIVSATRFETPESSLPPTTHPA